MNLPLVLWRVPWCCLHVWRGLVCVVRLLLQENHSGVCPLCSRSVDNVQVHIHNRHRPADAGPPEDRSPASMHAFGLVVCRRADGRFLVVQEFAQQGFWLPGGRVDAGEAPWVSVSLNLNRDALACSLRLWLVLCCAA